MYWFGVSKRDGVACELFSRHYSSSGFSVAHYRKYGVCPPGECMVLVGSDSRALFVWVRNYWREDGQEGVCCSVFRNESERLSSVLIVEASELAWSRWGDVRLFTYVDPGAVRLGNPGYCFKRAGWSLVRDRLGRARVTRRGLVLLETEKGR